MYHVLLTYLSPTVQDPRSVCAPGSNALPIIGIYHHVWNPYHNWPPKARHSTLRWQLSQFIDKNCFCNTVPLHGKCIINHLVSETLASDLHGYFYDEITIMLNNVMFFVSSLLQTCASYIIILSIEQ